MSNKEQLRAQRYNTILNNISKRQENSFNVIISSLLIFLQEEFGVGLVHESQVHLAAIISSLRSDFPDIDFHYYFESSSMAGWRVVVST